jgi:indole-3-glycerol phosphate synthase/phosphoribosylanthranilate isomerase
MNKLRQLLQEKRRDIDSRKITPGLAQKYNDFPQENRLVSWNRDRFHFIAEIKRASLSAGSIRPNLSVPDLAKSYESAGASAISVLTEERYFHGSLQDLRNVQSAVNIPVLQKDFILDEFQIHEAKFYGASFVLLIAKILTATELEAFQQVCDGLQMNAIVEITDEADLEKIRTHPKFLGVNSRNLETLEMDTSKFGRIRPFLPDTFLIAESGIHDTDLLKEIQDHGYHGALIGEHLLKAQNPATELNRFVESARAFRTRAHSRPRIKVCGITSEKDALLAIQSGANALGFIFADSPRRIDPQNLKQFRSKIPTTVLCVGVFRGQTRTDILKCISDFRLDVVQTYDDPAEIPGIVWNAHIARNHSDLDSLRVKQQTLPILWDIKVNDNDLTGFWSKLGTDKVFGLAGCLTPENVGKAISLCHPEWVDVARGVESSPGIKDPSRLKAFVKGVAE